MTILTSNFFCMDSTRSLLAPFSSVLTIASFCTIHDSISSHSLIRLKNLIASSRFLRRCYIRTHIQHIVKQLYSDGVTYFGQLHQLLICITNGLLTTDHSTGCITTCVVHPWWICVMWIVRIPHTLNINFSNATSVRTLRRDTVGWLILKDILFIICLKQNILWINFRGWASTYIVTSKLQL